MDESTVFEQVICKLPTQKENMMKCFTRRYLILPILTACFGLGATLMAAKDQEQGIPPELKGFKGMMTGKLLEKGEATLVFKVDGIKRVWKGNKAENPKKAVGKTLLLNLDKVSSHHEGRVMKNFRGLKKGDRIELEAFDLGGKSLSIKEWLKKVEGKEGE